MRPKGKRMVGTHQHWGYQSQNPAAGSLAVQTQRAECCSSPSRRQEEQAERQLKTTLSTVTQNLERLAGWTLGSGQMLVAGWRQMLGRQQALKAQSQTETKRTTLGEQKRNVSICRVFFPHPARMNLGMFLKSGS